MADQDLATMLARISETRVNRRSFLAAAGLIGGGAALAACTGGPGTSGGTVRTGGRRRRGFAVHLQLVGLHQPGQHRDVQGRVRGQDGPLRHLLEQRGADREAAGRRQRLRHRLPDRGVRAGHGRGGLPDQARPVAHPEHQVDRQDVQGPRLGPDRRIPGAQGLRHDGHPVPREADQEAGRDRGRSCTT